MILQCNPLIPLDTPKGLADAHFIIDYGRDAHLVFVCFVRATGECWCIEGPAVLLQANVTAGVRQPDRLAKVREQWSKHLRDEELAAANKPEAKQQVNDHEVCARDYAATLAAGKNVHEHGGEG